MPVGVALTTGGRIPTPCRRTDAEGSSGSLLSNTMFPPNSALAVGANETAMFRPAPAARSNAPVGPLKPAGYVTDDTWSSSEPGFDTRTESTAALPTGRDPNSSESGWNAMSGAAATATVTG